MAENEENIEVVVAAGLAKLDGVQLTDIYRFLDVESFYEVKETPDKTLNRPVASLKIWGVLLTPPPN